MTTAETHHPFPLPPGHWRALQATVLQVWHQQTHQRAGQQRVTTAQLRLGPTWAVAGRQSSVLRRLAQRLAADGAEVQVLVINGLPQPELRIGWAPWHAPPTDPHPRPLSPGAQAPNPSNPANPPHSSGALTMKLPNLRQLFTPDHSPNPGAHGADEPKLEAVGQRAAPGPGKQLPQALQQIAEQIDEQEVRHLLDTVDCRFQLWELTLYLTPGNQPALRGLMEVHQRNPAVARSIVERAFAGANGAGRLNTVRLKLDFKRGDSLPRDVSEVLLVCGRDNVTLPFSYTGQIELGPPVGSAASPGNPPARPAAPAAAAGSATELVLWGHVPNAAGQPTLQRWRFSSGPVQVGAADDAPVCVNHHHVSAEHLVLAQDAQGQWTVEDRSRNGSGLLDVLTQCSERPLPARMPQPLPAAGLLRLGPLPDDPLLSFHLVLPPVEAAAAAASGGRRRVTQLAGSVNLTAQLPAGRATDLT